MNYYYYPKYTKNDVYQTRYNRNKGNYYQRKNRNQNNNNYRHYNYYKKINYENTYEEEINYDKEINESSFSKSTHSNSRKNSFCENNNENNEVNQESSTSNISNDNNKEIAHEQNDNIAKKINISQDVIKSAFFVPKSYKEKNNIIKPENNNEQKEKIEIKEKKEKKDENIVILAINLKISKDKTIFFELRKYDDMFLVIKKFCEENNLNEKIQKFLPLVIIKALNSIYGIMNLKLTNEEIVYIKELREKYL